MTANQKAKAFLAAFRISGQITAAAEAAKIDRTTHYRWLKASAKYAEDFKQAWEEFGDAFEAEAIRRAKDGYMEPVFYQGVACGVVRRYDSGLMQMMLPRFKPEYRRGGGVEVTSKTAAAESSITVRFVDANGNPDRADDPD